MMCSKAQIFVVVLIALGISCSPLYHKENKVYQKRADSLSIIIRQPPVQELKDSVAYATPLLGTVNLNMRKPNMVILHHTEQGSCAETIRTFRLERTGVSAHYIVCKDGSVVHMLNDYSRAWHAGTSKWGNVNDINSNSIGIEIDNNGSEIFNDIQVNSLLSLLKYLKQKYHIPTANFIGHADITPARKDDPNYYFPWEKLAANGYGYWYDTTAVNVPESFNYLQGLRAIGYDIKDSVAALKAFRLHYEHKNEYLPFFPVDERDRKIIYAVLKRYL